MVKDNIRKTHLLARYRRIVDTWVERFIPLLREQELLQKERENLARARKPDPEKRADWNRRAAEWRKKKQRTLSKAVEKHKAIFSELIGQLLTLGGQDKLTFNNSIFAIAKDYDGPYNTLRRRSLKDLP